jgi:hypothetical protein
VLCHHQRHNLKLRDDFCFHRDAIFCNPPYSEFKQWVLKILNEANTRLIYFIVPERWQQDAEINQIIKERGAKTSVLAEFDFLQAERQARARVNVVKINFTDKYNDQKSNPFKRWFNQHFKLDIAEKNSPYRFDKTQTQKKSLHNKLVSSKDIVDSLVTFYNQAIDALLATYQSLEKIDRSIFAEMEIDLDKVMNNLIEKIENLKKLYWHELLTNTQQVSKQLTTDSRKLLFDTLSEHTSVDFNHANIRSVLIWILKNANSYIDTQLIKVVESLVDSANITGYKSNQNTFEQENWRYTRYNMCNGEEDKKPQRYKLDYRCVISRYTAIDSSYDSINNLSKNCVTFIDDLRTIAYNLGFDISADKTAAQHEWESGKKVAFHYRDLNGDEQTLMVVKAFKNGNLHFQISQQFLCKLNVEFGRLKGWLKSKEEAAEELDIPLTDVEASFDTLLQFKPENQFPLLQLAS